MTGGYVTRNNGESWHMFNLRGHTDAFAFDPVDPHVIYAGNAALWRSSDSGRTWKMIFPDPARNTVEHQIGDHSDYSLTTSDPAYPGGNLTNIAIAPPSDAKNGQGSAEHIYLSFEQRGQPAVIVSSADGGINWSRLATLPQHVPLLTNTRLRADCSLRLRGLAHRCRWKHAPNWAALQQASERPARRVLAIRFGFMQPARTEKVYLSEDSGQHFKAVTPELKQSAGKFEAIATSEHHPEVAYAGFRGLQIGAGQ